MSLSTFGNWLTTVRQAASGVTIPSLSSLNQKTERRIDKNKAFTNVHDVSQEIPSTSSEVSNQTRKCRACDGDCKSVDKCTKFPKVSLNDKWSVVKQFKLCRKCLAPHGQRRCRSSDTCGIDGCTFKHNNLLHKQTTTIATSPPTEQTAPCNIHQSLSAPILFRIVPIQISASNKIIMTYAFLDEGSSITVIEENLSGKLKLIGEAQPLCLKWTSNSHRVEQKSRRVSLKVSSFHNPHKLNTITARTVTALDLP